jgi:hypothetical protein
MKSSTKAGPFYLIISINESNSGCFLLEKASSHASTHASASISI